MSKFFINRPVFASVIALLIFLGGVFAITKLPIEQYPNLTPPTIQVSATYLGASPEVLATTVAAPLEQQINGVENMLYMDSTSASNGTLNLKVYFEVGTNPEEALINVNNRVQQATASLPTAVTKYGISVQKQSSSILLMAALYAPSGRFDTTYIANYALINIVDELKRINGVGDAKIMTANDYAIRIWLKPEMLNHFNLSVEEIISAIQIQNSQHNAGTIGGQPTTQNILLTYPLITPTRLLTPQEFENIILLAKPDGSTLKLKDVADITLGAQTYDYQGFENKQTSIPIGVYLSPGANAVQTAEAVKNALKEMSNNFPEGLEYDIAYDTTLFVKESIKGVVRTLIEAFILVFLVVYLFLKDWRATLIPCVVVPIAIVGAFLGMLILGFSINTLTLFGLVLAIGMVVDDAIVVIENVDRILHTENISIKDATIKAMDEVSGPIVAIVLVLCSVFIPVGFVGGFSGVMYQQFAITIAISVIISGLLALTLTPAMCAIFLKTEKKEVKGFFYHFDRIFEKITDKYVGIVKYFIHKFIIGIFVFLLFCLLSFGLFKKVPTSLLPTEDQGLLMIYTTLDAGTALNKTMESANILEDLILSIPQVEKEFTFSGFNILNSTTQTNSAASFVMLNPWKTRKKQGEHAVDIVKQISQMALLKIPKAFVMPFLPPAILGMSSTGGIEGYIQSRGDATMQQLAETTNQFIAKANETGIFESITTTFNTNYPQYTMTLDTIKAMALGVNIDSIYNVLSSTFGTIYVNDFTMFSRNFKVMIQGLDSIRAYPESINKLYVKSNKGEMIPLSSLITITPTLGPSVIERFNAFPSANLIVSMKDGKSSGDGITALEKLAKEYLPSGYSLVWSGTTLQEKKSGSSSAILLLLGVVVVFLILAAQYENWTLPLSVISAVPFAIFGAFLGMFLRGFSNGIYFQVALVALVGLAAKNAILIVEFASILKKQGKSASESALEGAKIRFRPIIMTSLAFILGTLPLAISTGAGASSQQSLGTAVVFGMLGATIIAPIFIPLFYYLLNRKYGDKPSFNDIKENKNV